MLEKIISTVTIEDMDFKKGEVIFSPTNHPEKIAFIASGECIVERVRTSDTIPLNILKKSDSFGILSIFSSGEEYPTRIKALTPARVLFINKDDIVGLVKRYSQIAMNVIGFLSGRIEFLNKKIAAFSGKSVEERLATYLLEKKKLHGCEFSFSPTAVALTLNVGRASLYRAIDSLTKLGYIKSETKKIVIICPEGLERI